MAGCRIDVIRLHALPSMAWCAVVRPEGRTTVLAGSLVEEMHHGFFEGAWSGDYGRDRFDLADVACGTGGLCLDDHVVFSTTTDTLQALYAYRRPGELLISNSLHLLLRVSGASLRLSYLMYDIDLVTVIYGLSAFRKMIPTVPEAIALYYHCNIIVGRNLAVTVQPKPVPPPFPDFASYDAFLRTRVENLVGNAAAPARHARFRPMATVSTGYDSPACATLAGAAGCREALTFTTARSDWFRETNDSGREVGARLHLSVSELDPCAYLRSTTLPECEFVAAGYGAHDVVFSGAEKWLSGTIVFTGFHGDRVWNPDRAAVSPDIVRGDPSGAGLAEFRLRVGFINAGVPFFGCLRHPEIQAISTSAEMAPWSVGRRYDRPIPRRIAEEGGVPRDVFGVSKKAIVRPYLRLSGRHELRICLSERTFSAFTSYLREPEVAASLARALRRHQLRKATIGRVVCSHKVGQLERALGTRWLCSPARQWRYSQNLSADSALFYWASTALATRYASAPTSASL